MTYPVSGYQSAAMPGWYPDPSGDWEQRWWSGTSWTDQVVTGGYQTTMALPDPSAPLLPAAERIEWEGAGHRVTTHRVQVAPARGSGRSGDELPLWTVARAEARGLTVALTVAYQGYTGRTTFPMPGVTDAPRVAAIIHLWANRNRRAATQVPPPYLPG